LAVLRSQLEALQDGVLAASPDLVDSLHDETLRLGRLVADLETMTSADGVAFSLRRESVDLADVVASAVADLDHRFTEQGLQLLPRLSPTPVCGDKARLRQVVTNLLTNALKFVPSGGSVSVTTVEDGGVAELTVADDGPGIPPEDLDRVFDRFYRGAHARAGGSGIGLAVVASLVKAHGGDVGATTHASGGASFRIRLPLEDEAH
jgi:two-component system sensor histidine kinase BaeS